MRKTFISDYSFRYFPDIHLDGEELEGVPDQESGEVEAGPGPALSLPPDTRVGFWDSDSGHSLEAPGSLLLELLNGEFLEQTVRLVPETCLVFDFCYSYGFSIAQNMAFGVNDKPQRGSLEAAKPESNKCDIILYSYHDMVFL